MHTDNDRVQQRQRQTRNEITAVCVKISQTLGYTIDEILDHDLEWICLISREIDRREFNATIFQMSLHGVDPVKIRELQAEFDEEEKGPENIRIPLSQFQHLGLAFGRDNKTTVVRGGK